MLITPSRSSRFLPRLAALLLSAGACGGGGADCVVVPCPQPEVLELAVTPAEAARGASIAVAGPVVGGGPCTAGVCRVFGTAGTYELDVSAPGYQTVHRRVVVPGDNPECGCPTAETQRLSVALPPAT